MMVCACLLRSLVTLSPSPFALALDSSASVQHPLQRPIHNCLSADDDAHPYRVALCVRHALVWPIGTPIGPCVHTTKPPP